MLGLAVVNSVGFALMLTRLRSSRLHEHDGMIGNAIAETIVLHFLLPA